MRTALKISIGDIIFAVIPNRKDIEYVVPTKYKGFITTSSPDVILRTHSHDINLYVGRHIFQSGGTWTLYAYRDKWVIFLRSPAVGPNPYTKVILEPDFCSGDIYFTAQEADSRQVQFPLGYPLGELLIVNLLAKGRGVLMHAFAVNDNGVGILFAGTSGAGKSTSARLWRGTKGVTLLSDDRVVVRKRDGRFWIYGTPWHGDEAIVSPESAPLDKIFILNHASKNQISSLNPIEATSRLLVRSFPTYWDADGMAFTLQFLTELTHAVPCYELGFVPEQSAVEFVRENLSN